MTDLPIWFDVAPAHGVLEFDPRLTPFGHALELHVVVCEDETTFAWWESENGGWLGVAETGQA